jgi:hypothetical protein
MMGAEMEKRLNGLLVSRKFWLACLGVGQSIVLHYLNVPQEIWVSINGLLVAVIAGITVEDAAQKFGRDRYK